jgi:hypothetical protein
MTVSMTLLYFATIYGFMPVLHLFAFILLYSSLVLSFYSDFTFSFLKKKKLKKKEKEKRKKKNY